MKFKASLNIPSSPIIPSSTAVTNSRPTPRQLAIALTRLEGEQYKRIFPIEYVAHAVKLLLYCPNLSAAIDLNRLIVNWVQSCILTEELGKGRDGAQKRGKWKQFFIETAKVTSTFGPIKYGT
jgi:hypothetical protein